MDRFIDKIVGALTTFLPGKEKVDSGMESFLNKGNNGILVLSVLFFIPFLIVSVYLYNNFENRLWSLVPLTIYVCIYFLVAIAIRMRKRSGMSKSRVKSKPTGFNLDLNTLVMKKLFGYLTKYEYVNKELTSYEDFYKVMTYDFDHDLKDNYANLPSQIQQSKMTALGENQKETKLPSAKDRWVWVRPRLPCLRQVSRRGISPQKDTLMRYCISRFLEHSQQK